MYVSVNVCVYICYTDCVCVYFCIQSSGNNWAKLSLSFVPFGFDEKKKPQTKQKWLYRLYYCKHGQNFKTIQRDGAMRAGRAGVEWLIYFLFLLLLIRLPNLISFWYGIITVANESQVPLLKTELSECLIYFK